MTLYKVSDLLSYLSPTSSLNSPLLYHSSVEHVCNADNRIRSRQHRLPAINKRHTRNSLLSPIPRIRFYIALPLTRNGTINFLVIKRERIHINRTSHCYFLFRYGSGCHRSMTLSQRQTGISLSQRPDPPLPSSSQGQIRCFADVDR